MSEAQSGKHRAGPAAVAHTALSGHHNSNF